MKFASNKNTSFKFHSDSGHGWLAVKRVELSRLGLLDKVSHYSYQRGATVYLEEDADAHLFLSTKHKLGEVANVVHSSSIVHRSPIRSYDSFKKEQAQ